MLRDQNGKWIVGFSSRLGSCSFGKDELLALVQGLRVTWNTDIKKLIVQMDSEVVIRKMKAPPKSNQAYYQVIKQCQNLIYSAE